MMANLNEEDYLDFKKINREVKNIQEQTGAELCQAQTPVGLPAEAELSFTVEFQIWA